MYAEETKLTENILGSVQSCDPVEKYLRKDYPGVSKSLELRILVHDIFVLLDGIPL